MPEELQTMALIQMALCSNCTVQNREEHKLIIVLLYSYKVSFQETINFVYKYIL